MTDEPETPATPATPETPEAPEAVGESAPLPEPEDLDTDETSGAAASGRGVDDAIIDAINEMQHATINPDAVRAVAGGKAYQLIALSAALAVQDATDMLRNNTMIASTASGIALSALIETGDPRFQTSIVYAQTVMTDAIANYEAIGKIAAQLLASFSAAEKPAASDAD